MRDSGQSLREMMMPKIKLKISWVVYPPGWRVGDPHETYEPDDLEHAVTRMISMGSTASLYADPVFYVDGKMKYISALQHVVTYEKSMVEPGYFDDIDGG